MCIEMSFHDKCIVTIFEHCCKFPLPELIKITHAIHNVTSRFSIMTVPQKVEVNLTCIELYTQELKYVFALLGRLFSPKLLSVFLIVHLENNGWLPLSKYKPSGNILPQTILRQYCSNNFWQY